jgi:hypothetical protein
MKRVKRVKWLRYFPCMYEYETLKSVEVISKRRVGKEED